MIGWILGLVVALAGLGLAVLLGTVPDASPATPIERPGYRVLRGRKGFEVWDLQRARQYAEERAQVAPYDGWLAELHQDLFGPSRLLLGPSDLLFRFRLLRSALVGAVGANVLAPLEAQAILTDLAAETLEGGVAAADLGPLTLEDG